MNVTRLDLHTISHEEAPAAAHEFINVNWRTPEVHVIARPSAGMKGIVRRVLSHYQVEVLDGDPRNTGYLRVLG